MFCGGRFCSAMKAVTTKSLRAAANSMFLGCIGCMRGAIAGYLVITCPLLNTDLTNAN